MKFLRLPRTFSGFFQGKLSSEIRCFDPPRKKFYPSTFNFWSRKTSQFRRNPELSDEFSGVPWDVRFFFVGGTVEKDQNVTSMKKKHHPDQKWGRGVIFAPTCAASSWLHLIWQNPFCLCTSRPPSSNPFLIQTHSGIQNNMHKPNIKIRGRT